MKRIAKFQKVSYEQFTEGWIDTFGATNAEEIKTIYGIYRYRQEEKMFRLEKMFYEK